MVIECSADTYDWERLHAIAQSRANLVQTLGDIHQQYTETDSHPTLDWETVCEQSRNAIIDEFGESNVSVLTSANGDEYLIEANPEFTAGASTALILRLRESGDAVVTFKARCMGDDRTIVDEGPLTSEACATDKMMSIIDFLYQTQREAISLSDETTLSEREAQALLLTDEGYDRSEIARLMDVSQGNIATYLSRLSDKRAEAVKQKAAAERTLEVIDGRVSIEDGTVAFPE